MSASFSQITTTEEFDALIERSFASPVALLKHSNTCGISANVMYDLKEVDAEISYLVVQESRELSNLIAYRLVYRHQSPQAFVISKGEVTYHATHYGIDGSRIEEALRS